VICRRFAYPLITHCSPSTHLTLVTFAPYSPSPLTGCACRQQVKGRFNGFESRAHLLFPARLMSATSTPSELSQRTELSHDPPTPPITPSKSQINAITDPGTTYLSGSHIKSTSTLPAVSAISLVYSDLPSIRSISIMTPSLHLQIGKLSVTIIFYRGVVRQIVDHTG
jgi:hypothetical protein